MEWPLEWTGKIRNRIIEAGHLTTEPTAKQLVHSVIPAGRPFMTSAAVNTCASVDFTVLAGFTEIA